VEKKTKRMSRIEGSTSNLLLVGLPGRKHGGGKNYFTFQSRGGTGAVRGWGNEKRGGAIAKPLTGRCYMVSFTGGVGGKAKNKLLNTATHVLQPGTDITEPLFFRLMGTLGSRPAASLPNGKSTKGRATGRE